ncbi:ribose-5-phosphate isomerase A [Weissella confusa]|uniref:Ribose-5-phosphate isomerase A n=1 Tax=Weissella confusa TaxID=1583 RepID=A0A923NEA0_WEICO|nr:ribose-5-phosphate isomerase A [Weissella confusa]
MCITELGHFPLPVEVVSYGEQQLCRLFKKHNLNPILRLDEDGRPLTTDNGNNIIDLHLDTIPFPEELAT